MKFFIFTQFTAIILAITFTACKSSPKEQIAEAYKFRHKAVFSQTRYLADDIGQTYTDKDATMEDLNNFIKKSPRVEKVTLASVPMVIHPFSISLTEVLRAAPKPIGKYILRKRFNMSEDMVWYRRLLCKKDAYWYQSEQNSEVISYIYPVLKELNPDVVLYILKLDFNQSDNPTLFWDVPHKYYTQELLRLEKEYLKKYFFLKKQAEEKDLTAEQRKQFKEAKPYYDFRFKRITKIGEQREKELKLRQKEESQ